MFVSGADGLAIDNDGRIYAATAAGVEVFEPEGRAPRHDSALARAAEHRVCRARQEDAVHRRPWFGVQGGSADAGIQRPGEVEGPAFRPAFAWLALLSKPSNPPASAAAGSAASSRRPSGSSGWAPCCVFTFPSSSPRRRHARSTRCRTCARLLHLVLIAAFVLGAISLTLRQNKALGTVGVAAALIAARAGRVAASRPIGSWRRGRFSASTGCC